MFAHIITLLTIDNTAKKDIIDYPGNYDYLICQRLNLAIPRTKSYTKGCDADD